MITDAKSFLFLIGTVTKEEVLDEGVTAMEGLVNDWADQIAATGVEDGIKLRAAIYQGALLGIQIAARARAQLARQAASDRGIVIDE